MVSTPQAAAKAPPGTGRPGPALFVIATAQLMVVLDGTVMTVALPRIQQALGFSGDGLAWVVNAYALAFGGLILLGGRAGDLLGRRGAFTGGLALFTVASMAGGMATSQAWLLAARAVQGAGAAVVAPTALALITTTFPEGRPRNRAMGVYAAMSGLGSAIGLIAGGLLTSYASWRWVLFVNVPIGLAMMLAAPRVLPGSDRARGQLDLPGTVTGCGGIAALAYGLSAAAPSGLDSPAHWGATKVIASFSAAAVLLAAFAVIEYRSRNPLLPLRLLADRTRAGANLALVCTGAALFGMFFFLTLFLQEIWGYSAVTAGLAYLPMTAAIGIASGLSAQLAPRIGARPVLAAGSVLLGGGLLWLSRLSVHGQFAVVVLGPSVVAGAGLGLLFVPLTLGAMTRVDGTDSGVAASLRNASQQLGGAIGLAVFGTVAFSAAARSASTQMARTAARTPNPAARTAVFHQALTTGFSRGIEAAAAVMILALVIVITMIRLRRSDLAGASHR